MAYNCLEIVMNVMDEPVILSNGQTLAAPPDNQPSGTAAVTNEDDDSEEDYISDCGKFHTQIIVHFNILFLSIIFFIWH